MLPRNNRAGGLVAGSLLIGLGVLFLVAQVFDIAGWRYLWPVFVIAMGGFFFAGMFAGDRSAAGLAIPGSIVTMVGVLLLLQNVFQAWATWSYGWTLIIVAVGVGLAIMGWRLGQAELRQRGWRVAGVGLVLFIIFGALSELGGLLFGARGAAQIVFPVLLIGLGLYLIVRRMGWWPSRGETSAPPEPPAADQTPQP